MIQKYNVNFKFIPLLFIFLLSILFSDLQGQASIGVNFGPNYSDLYLVNYGKVKENNESISPGFGVNLGMYINYEFKKFKISSGLGYSVQRVTPNIESALAVYLFVIGDEDMLQSHFIEFPLSVSYRIVDRVYLGLGVINSYYVSEINKGEELNNKYRWYRGGVQSFISYDISERFRSMILYKYNGLNNTWQHPSISMELQYDLFQW